MYLRSDRLRISAGFICLIVWFSAVNGLELLFLILGAVMVHELGHLSVLYLFGAKIHALRISVMGAVLEADCQRLSYGKELAAVLAGPAMNLICVWLLSHFVVGCETVVGIHLILGGFNLLPIRPLDGGRALELFLTWIFGPFIGETITCGVSVVAAGFLAICICCLMYATGGSLWLLPAAAGLLGTAWRECFEKSEILQF